MANSSKPGLDAEDRDPAGGRVPPDVVREREARRFDLARAGATLELEHVLVDHAHARRPRRVPEALESAVGVHRELAAEREGPRRDVLLALALRAEAQVLVGEQLGEREAVVELRDVDLAEGVVDPR